MTENSAMANLTQSTFDPSRRELMNGDNGYGAMKNLYTSQLQTYHHNQRIAEVLQQRLRLSRQQEYFMRSGSSCGNFQFPEKTSNSSALWKLDNLRYNQLQNQRLMLIPQEAGALQIGRNNQLNLKRGELPYHSMDSEHPGLAAAHHYKPNHAEFPQYTVHHRGKDASNLNRNAKRSVSELLAHQWPTTDGEYLWALHKRPRLSPGISPVSLYVQNHVAHKNYSQRAVCATPTLQTSMGNVPSVQTSNHHYAVSSNQRPLSHLEISNIHTQSVNNIRHVGRKTGSSEQDGRSAHTTLENRHPLARQSCHVLPNRSQQSRAYGGLTAYPLEMISSQYSTTQIPSSMRVTQREDYHTLFAGPNQEVRAKRGAVAMNLEAIHRNSESEQHSKEKILYRVLTSSEKPPQQTVITDPTRHNLSHTKSNVFDANISTGFQQTLNCEVIKNEVPRMIPRTLTYISNNSRLKKGTTSTNNSQKERPPDQNPAMTTWNANHDNLNTVLNARSRGNCNSTKSIANTNRSANRLSENPHETNIRHTKQVKVHMLKNCFHDERETQKRDSETNKLMPNNFIRDLSENHDEKQKVNKKNENIMQVSTSKQKQLKNGDVSKGILDPNRGGFKMSYGTFLQEVVVPMTLAVSQRENDRQKSLESILAVWHKQRKLLTFDGTSDGDVYFKNAAVENNTYKKEIKTNTLEVSRTSEPQTASVEYFNGTSTPIIRKELYARGKTSTGILPKEVDSCTINLDEENVDDVKPSNRDLDINGDIETDHGHMSVKVGGETISKRLYPKVVHEECTMTENDDDQLNMLSRNSLGRKSVRVVLKKTDRIKMKFYNVGNHSYTTEGNQYIKREKRDNDVTTDKKILMRIGSERLFTRFYRSKSLPVKTKRKQRKKRNQLTSVPKDFTRIALSVHKTSGETILHRIARLNAKHVLRYCLDSGYHYDVNVADHAGYTPLHECCVSGRLWVAEQLIHSGANVNVNAHDGTRPLHDAVENGYTDLVRLLLSHGADPLEPTYAKRTALDNAKSVAMRKLLLDYLTDVNGTSDDLTAKLKTSTRSPSKIRFRTSYSTQGNDSWNDTFLDTSSLDEVDKNRVCNSLLYLTERPQPEHFRLQLKEDERIKTWYFLFDVLLRLSIPAATFPYLYPHIKVQGLPTDIFIKKVNRARGLLQYYHPEVYSSRELIEFVEADDEMSAILQLEGWTC